MIQSNTWNRIRYTLYRPFYNVIARLFYSYRSLSISSLELRKNDKILIVGAGTGLDLIHLENEYEITAIDITPSMISTFKKQAEELSMTVHAEVMDASNMNFHSNQFDVVILHLIVAVLPDPIGCLKETERVLKPGGKFTIMDKFLTSGSKPSMLRKMINIFANILATNLNRDIDALLSTTTLIKTTHQKLGSIFWLIQGQKKV